MSRRLAVKVVIALVVIGFVEIPACAKKNVGPLSMAVDTNYFEVIKVSEVYELPIPGVHPLTTIDCVDWSDSNRIVFNVTDDWEGRFSHVYLVDPNGSNLKKLTSGNRKCTDARWILGNKIGYIENKKLSIMDTDGNDISELLPAEVRDACRNPWLLSDNYGLIQDKHNEIILLFNKSAKKRLSTLGPSTRWKRASASFGLVSDQGGFVLAKDKVQYRSILQKISLKDGEVYDLALYRGPSTKSFRSFACSPDGKTIVYITGHEMWAMSNLGSNSHRIYEGTDKSPQYGAIAFSPKGDKIIFSSRELKGDRKWRLWVATLEKATRKATFFDKLETIIISKGGGPHAITSDEILAWKKNPDQRIAIQEVNLDVDVENELLVILQRSKEKDIIILDNQGMRYLPIWWKRCFYYSCIQLLDINDTDNIKAIALHANVVNHGDKDDCCIYRFNQGTMEQIWHEVLTDIYNRGYTGKLTLKDGPGYKDLIVTITIHWFTGDKTGPIGPRETLELLYKWDGEQYVGDKIEEWADRMLRKLKAE